MENIQHMAAAENLSSDMERFIISAHKKYFEGNSETLVSLNNTEAGLYDTVLRYFKGTS
jgi:hypothetical protein